MKRANISLETKTSNIRTDPKANTIPEQLEKLFHQKTKKQHYFVIFQNGERCKYL